MNAGQSWSSSITSFCIATDSPSYKEARAAYRVRLQARCLCQPAGWSLGMLDDASERQVCWSFPIKIILTQLIYKGHWENSERWKEKLSFKTCVPLWVTWSRNSWRLLFINPSLDTSPGNFSAKESLTIHIKAIIFIPFAEQEPFWWVYFTVFVVVVVCLIPGALLSPPLTF